MTSGTASLIDCYLPCEVNVFFLKCDMYSHPDEGKLEPCHAGYGRGGKCWSLVTMIGFGRGDGLLVTGAEKHGISKAERWLASRCSMLEML